MPQGIAFQKLCANYKQTPGRVVSGHEDMEFLLIFGFCGEGFSLLAIDKNNSDKGVAWCNKEK